MLGTNVTRVRGARTAVVGCGYWGRNLVRNFHELGALDAIVDADPKQAAEFAGRFGVPARQWSEVLDDSQMEAVVIATPAATHADLCRAAIEAGKHVFVEKPLALAVGEAEDLVVRAERRGVRLMVGHLLHYHPAFLALQRLVATGTLGRLQYIYSHRLNLGKIRREENVFWSFAPHDLSMILALAGEMPERVLATGAAYLHQSIADTTTTHLDFGNGIHAHVFVSWLHPFKEQKLVVVGDRAMAAFDDREPWESKLVLYRHQIQWKHGLPEPERADAEPVTLAPAEPLRLECQHFLDCIAGHSRPRTCGSEGLRVLRVLDAAERSMTGRRPVWLSTTAANNDTAAPTPEEVSTGTDAFQAHPSAVIDPGCEIGAGTRIWHFSHVMAGSRIGADCTLGQNVVVGPDAVIGARCKIQNNVSIYKGVTLEDGVFCGPSCVFTNVLTPRAEIERKAEFLPTVVARGATIGANATIVCGISIGAWSLIAAGAVVTRDVPAFALMAGVPARRVGWVSHAGERLDARLVCPREGRRYRQVAADRLEEIIPSPVSDVPEALVGVPAQ